MLVPSVNAAVDSVEIIAKGARVIWCAIMESLTRDVSDVFAKLDSKGTIAMLRSLE